MKAKILKKMCVVCKCKFVSIGHNKRMTKTCKKACADYLRSQPRAKGRKNYKAKI